MPRPPATLHDVARRAGVSIATASRALGGSAAVLPATAAGVRAAATALGYRPGFAARAMRQGRSRIVGVALLNHAGGQPQSLQNYEILIGVNRGLEKAGLLMALLRLDDLDDGPGALALREQTLDAVVAVGELPERLRRTLRRLSPRTVWVDGPEWTEDGCLRRDEVRAGALAVEGIAARGHRALRWLDAPGGHHAFSQRRAGAEVAAKRLGLHWITAPPADGVPAAWRDGVPLLVPDIDTLRGLAVVLNGARIAAGADLPLACCDDAQDLRSAWPGLSRVAYDRVALGVAAAEAVRARLDDAPFPSRLLIDGWIAGDTLPQV